jgi:hypothetical protein
MRASSPLQSSRKSVHASALIARNGSFARIASKVLRFFVEPTSIDHESGIYSAELPPFFASRRRDDF